MLYQLIYASRATRGFEPDELARIVSASRRSNASCGVTGMLLYDAGSFLQVLEGEQADVERTFAKIERDRRHTGVRVVSRGPVKHRNFPQWSMGLLELTPAVRAKPAIGGLMRSAVATAKR